MAGNFVHHIAKMNEKLYSGSIEKGRKWPAKGAEADSSVMDEHAEQLKMEQKPFEDVQKTVEESAPADDVKKESKGEAAPERPIMVRNVDPFERRRRRAEAQQRAELAKQSARVGT